MIRESYGMKINTLCAKLVINYGAVLSWARHYFVRKMLEVVINKNEKSLNNKGLKAII